MRLAAIDFSGAGDIPDESLEGLTVLACDYGGGQVCGFLVSVGPIESVKLIHSDVNVADSAPNAQRLLSGIGPDEALAGSACLPHSVQKAVRTRFQMAKKVFAYMGHGRRRLSTQQRRKSRQHRARVRRSKGTVKGRGGKGGQRQGQGRGGNKCDWVWKRRERPSGPAAAPIVATTVALGDQVHELRRSQWRSY